MINNCSLCERVDLIKKNQYPFLIKEFEQCYWLLGEHQYYDGYTVLLLKNHHKEMTELNPDQQNKVFKELMQAQKIIETIYQPLKMNLCMLGNVVPHVHWHLFPRYESDPNKLDPVWLKMHEFSSRQITTIEAQTIIKKIQELI